MIRKEVEKFVYQRRGSSQIVSQTATRRKRRERTAVKEENQTIVENAKIVGCYSTCQKGREGNVGKVTRSFQP